MARSMANVVVLADGVPVFGWAEGNDNPLTIKKHSKGFTKHVSGDGKVVDFGHDPDPSGEINLVLMSGTISCEHLNLLHKTKKVFTVAITDFGMNSGTYFSCVVENIPDDKKGNKAHDREYKILFSYSEDVVDKSIGAMGVK